MTTPVDEVSFSGISATTAAFPLKGGYYLTSCVATFGGGTVDLQLLGPDQSTWLATPTASHFTANGIVATAWLPPGQYRFAIATATGVSCSVSGVPIS
jgi:hypothetical protein